jgi:23S rRNA (adenine1618-N6)-methyltransferase
MHPRNPHKNGYHFEELAKAYPPLLAHLAPKPDGKLTIDFAQPNAVKSLNAALLSHYYQVHFWDIPDGYLCPAVPGRADYIHSIADLLAETLPGQNIDDTQAKGKQIKGLDIGTGANLIYPIIGSQTYGWQMTGTDVHEPSYQSAKVIAKSNKNLSKLVKVKLQSPPSIFEGIISNEDYYTFTMSNPPFHESASAAMSGSRKKNKNLARHAHKRRGGNSSADNRDKLNFGGQHNELWCEGGEFAFVKQMLKESQVFSKQVGWFTSLLSKKDSVPGLEKFAKHLGVSDWRVVNMSQGAKASRFIAWRFE